MPESRQDQVLIALGSNEGDRDANLLNALKEMSSRCGTIVAQASFIETEPVGAADRKFLNSACIIRTGMTPTALLAELLTIEADLGRVRRVKWGNRCIDLDIILWRDQAGEMLRVDSVDLKIPHPFASQRAFVLEPASEIAGTWEIDPGVSVKEALIKLNT